MLPKKTSYILFSLYILYIVIIYFIYGVEFTINNQFISRVGVDMIT